MNPLDEHILREFLADAHEGLDQLDRHLLAIESGEPGALPPAFRALHTIKGACGFLGFRRLEKLAHAGESVLARIRAGDLAPAPDVTAALFGAVDAIRALLGPLESTGAEPAGDDHARLAALEQLLGAPRARLGEILVEQGVVTAEEVAEALDAQGVGATPDVRRRNVRVAVERLDRLVDLVGELVLARNQIVERSSHDARGIAAAHNRLHHVTSQLQEDVLRARMLPISTLWARLPRAVHDAAAACGKQAQLVLEGATVELDRAMVEALQDPLLHLVRNAVDHGLEAPEARSTKGKPPEGRITLRAVAAGGRVRIEIEDDGAGLSIDDVRRVALERGVVRPEEGGHFTEADWARLIFRSGFSTAPRITHLSGRGVGLDVVRTSLDRIGGTVDVRWRAGHGCTFTLLIPLTLAIVPALLIEEGGERYAVPQSALLEIVRATGRDLAQRLERVHGAPVYRLRGELLPVIVLAEALRLPRSGAPDAEAARLLVLDADGRRHGLLVSGVQGTQEIVVKPLPEALRVQGTYSGATILGDGRAAAILDVAGIASRAGLARASEPPAAAPTPSRGMEQQMLLVRARREPERIVAIPASEVLRIEELDGGCIVAGAAGAVARHRDALLPVAHIAERIGEAAPPFASDRSYATVIVLHATGPVGFVTEGVIDIVRGATHLSPQGMRAGLAGRVLVAGQVADMLVPADAAQLAFDAPVREPA